MQNTPLIGQRILVTRPEPQGAELCASLSEKGANTYYVPTLEIQARAINLHFFMPDIAIFMSANAVKYYPYSTFPASTSYFAVGVATAVALMQRGVIAQQPEKSDSEGLLLLPDLQKVKNKEVAIFCGMGGRLLLHETLKKRGAHCQRYEVYERRCAVQQSNYLQDLLKTVLFDYVICTSGENLLCLEKLAGMAIELCSVRLPLEVFQEHTSCVRAPYHPWFARPEKPPAVTARNILYELPLVVISQRIASIASSRGFKRILVVDNFTDNASIVRQLIKWKERE